MFDRVVAFLPGYATAKNRQYDIVSIPGNRLSDLIYCFAGFKHEGQNWVAMFPEPADAGAKHLAGPNRQNAEK